MSQFNKKKIFQVWKTILDENEKVAQARLAAIQVWILKEKLKSMVLCVCCVCMSKKISNVACHCTM